MNEKPAHDGELSDAEIKHLWDTRVGQPTVRRPLDDSDKRAFARAVIAAHQALRSSGKSEDPVRGYREHEVVHQARQREGGGT